MSLVKNKLSYTSTIEKLRNDLHRDVVQTAALMDVEFYGFYEFDDPIDIILTYYNNDRELKGRPIKIIGIAWDGNIVSEDSVGKDIHIRYMDLTIEQLDTMLIYLRRGDFKKSELTLSI